MMAASAMAAVQADRLLIEQFFELELLAASLGDESDLDADPLLSSLRTVYGRLATLSSGVVWFDEHGNVVFAEPASSTHLGANADQIKSGVGINVRSVSMPSLPPTSGHVEVLASVSRLRTRFIAIGAASLVTLLAGGALAVGVRRRTKQIDGRAT